MHEHFVQVVIIIITQNGNTTIDQLIDHASLRTSVAAVHAGLQAIYRAHLFTMSLLPSNLQVRPIVNKWACFSVGGSLQPITNILCAATDVGMHGLLASQQSCYHSVLPPSLCTLPVDNYQTTSLHPFDVHASIYLFVSFFHCAPLMCLVLSSWCSLEALTPLLFLRTKLYQPTHALYTSPTLTYKEPLLEQQVDDPPCK